MHAEYTSMLLSVHAICSSASAPRQPNISGADHQSRVIARASRTASSSVR
jgi:hypothetical protein